MAGSYIINVPKLRGRENYDEWAFAAENFLILEGVDITKQDAGDGEHAVSVDDQKAKAKLAMTIDSSLYVHIKNEKTALGIWKKLKTLFDDSGFTRRISLLRNLISIRLESSESMTAYVTQLIDTAQKLRGTGFDINEEWIGSLLLAGLPDKFSPMIMAIEHSGLAISADVIKTKLLDMSDNVGNSESESAFLSSKGWRRKGNKVGKTGETSSRPVKVIKCYRCKKTGHYKNQCPQMKEKQVNAFSAVFLNGSYDKHDWYIDSGASSHMMISQENLKAVHDLSTKQIIVANRTTMPVLCSGDTQITTVVNNKEYDVVVKDVLCIPDLTTNLLSVSQLIKHGNKVSFQSECCYIRNWQNELIGIGQLVNGVYKLNTRSACLFAASATTTSNVIWHRRLGHINSKDMNDMRNGAVKGLEFEKKAEISKFNCRVCCEAKQTRLPFPHSNNRSEHVLEKIHADVCGPMETKSIGSSRYFLLFIDDYSRMSFVYFLQNKSEVYSCFKEFRIMVEKQMNCSIKVLRTDNGTEFCSNEMENYLKQCGIIHQRTNPYTPEQNGICERFNRTIVERARCLLYDAKFEKKFWAEAVHTAVYLKNRTVASGLNQKTPYELWTGCKPNVSHIRIFGSIVMAHIPKQKRLKWDKKAEKHYLVGYADNVKGYRLYNPRSNKVITCRDVTIMEDNNSETVQATIHENKSSSNSDDQHRDSDGSDSETSTSTVKSNNNDSTYIEESNSHSSSDEFFDSITAKELKNLQSGKTDKTVRKTKKPDRYGYSNVCVETDINLCADQLITYEEVMNGEESKQWCKAMQDELKSFEENEAWDVVDRPEKATVVKCKWVFKKKVDCDNNVRYRARLVAKGFSQKAGIDYTETFSPVVRHSTIRLLFALSVKYNLDITHLDVTTAFLNGHLNENVYMSLPENFECNDRENKVLKLKRAVYGLKQSARAWYKRVDDCLQTLGYNKSVYEPCLFMKQTDTARTYIALFVDDFFVFSDCKKETEFLKNELKSKFKLKDLGEIRQCLGMRIRKENNEIFVDQEQFVDHLLDKFQMKNCNPVSTPMEVNLKLEKGDNNCSKQYPYQQLIGSLLYLSMLTRPDIFYAVCYLSQFNNSYNETHWKHAKRILKYLKKTKHFGLKYVKDDLDLIGYADADWASDCVDRKSYTGFMFKMSGSVVSFECKKQSTIALSSTEAEYMAICEASKEAIYLKNLLLELKCRSESPVLLYNDNQSAQLLTKHSVFHKRSKHIDTRFHFVRTAVENNYVKIEYLNTNHMPADIFTKSLSCQKHNNFVQQLGVTTM